MARLNNGINGGFSGKVGAVIGFQRFGQSYIRGLPRKRTAKVGAGEQANRDRFAVSQKWLKPLVEFLRIGFKGYAPTYQGFVAAKSYNSKHALKQDENNGNWFIDPFLALVSHGQLPLPHDITVSVEANEVVFGWTLDNGNNSDCAMLLAYDVLNNIGEYDLIAGERRAKTARLRLPEGASLEHTHLYLAFVTFDHSMQSNSQYLGTAAGPTGWVG